MMRMLRRVGKIHQTFSMVTQDGRPQGSPPHISPAPVPTISEQKRHRGIVGTGEVWMRGGAPCGRPSSPGAAPYWNRMAPCGRPSSPGDSPYWNRMAPCGRPSSDCHFIPNAHGRQESAVAPCGRPSSDCHSSNNFRSLLTALALLVLFSLALSSCGFPGIVSTSAQLPQVRPTSTNATLPPVRFPQDEAPHRDLTEWWYYTGHMNATTPDGKLHHYGFEFVIFQALRSDLPPIYAAHFAISNVTGGQFHFDQRRLIEPNAVLPNGTSISGFNLALGNWTMRGLNGSDHLSASMTNYAIQLNLLGLKQPTLHNGNGLITYGLGGFSYYYSRTRMSLSGTLVDHNQSLHVTGEAWMDHQWGNFLALGGGGWDWFSVQLNNFTEMMIYRIRDASGKAISTYVGYVGPHADNHLLPASALHITVLGHWTSPVTHITYPSGWRLNVASSQLQASLTLIPQLKDQELVVYSSTGNTYWEGAVSIQGQGAGTSVQGEGYVELTGYVRG